MAHLFLTLASPYNKPLSQYKISLYSIIIKTFDHTLYSQKNLNSLSSFTFAWWAWTSSIPANFLYFNLSIVHLLIFFTDTPMQPTKTNQPWLPYHLPSIALKMLSSFVLNCLSFISNIKFAPFFFNQSYTFNQSRSYIASLNTRNLAKVLVFIIGKQKHE